MSHLALSRDQYFELEKLALGALAPLGGFMNEEEFHGAVEDMRLPNGAVFPLPVVLDVDADRARAFQGRPTVTLTYEGREVGTLSPESFFRCDRRAVAVKVFGTADAAHPGVAHFLGLGEVFVGGPVRLTGRAQSEVPPLELTPEETRAIFAAKGWRKVVGFQTRNVPHRAHEYLHRVALELADGLFIQPLIGRRKAGDYTPEAIVSGYRELISKILPAHRVVLGTLSFAMRYAGPREAVLHAIIRRNYGCTHFIIGRDHAGVGNFYGRYDAHELTRRFEDELGIEILALSGPYHCAICDGIVSERTCAHARSSPQAITEISGTDIRERLMSGASLPPHLMRPELLDRLRGVELFIGPDEP